MRGMIIQYVQSVPVSGGGGGVSSTMVGAFRRLVSWNLHKNSTSLYRQREFVADGGCMPDHDDYITPEHR